MAAARRGRVPASRVLLVACFGAFLAFLDATIVNVAFPSIRASFPGESIGSLSWVLNAYNIVFAAFLIVCGRLTDLLGRRRAFLGGIALFTLASALCGAAPTLDLLVAARVRAGAGRGDAGARLAGPGRRGLPEDRRSHAIGLWGATAAVAAGLGPPIGGALVELGGWRWAFLVNIPFGLAALRRRPQPAGREPGARPAPDAGPASAPRCSRSPWRCSTWGSSRAATGAGAAPPCSGRSPPPLSWLALFVRQLAAAPLAAARPGAAAHPVVPIAAAATVAGGPRLLRLPADQHPLAAVRLGVRRAAGRPGAGARCAGRRGRGRPARAARRPVRVPVLRRARRAGLGRRLPLVPPAGRARAGLLGGVAAGPGAVSGIGVGATLPLLGSAALAAVPGRPVRDGVGRGLQRPPARWRAGHLDPRPDRRRPDAGPAVVAPSATAGCCRSWPSSLVALVAAADRQGRLRPARTTRTSSTARRCCCCPTAACLAPEHDRDALRRSAWPTSRCVAALSEDARPR